MYLVIQLQAEEVLVWSLTGIYLLTALAAAAYCFLHYASRMHLVEKPVVSTTA